jgi:hypothetical protein
MAVPGLTPSKWSTRLSLSLSGKAKFEDLYISIALRRSSTVRELWLTYWMPTHSVGLAGIPSIPFSPLNFISWGGKRPSLFLGLFLWYLALGIRVIQSLKGRKRLKN